MPNIELHGYGKSASTMKEKIRAVLNTSPDAAEIVTTTVPDTVEDLTGKQTPFLRVISSQEGLPDLKGRLASLNEDIELIFLGEWIPKRT